MVLCPQCNSESVVFGSFGGGLSVATIIAACLKCGLFWTISERDGFVIKRLPIVKDFRKKIRKKILKRHEVDLPVEEKSSP